METTMNKIDMVDVVTETYLVKIKTSTDLSRTVADQIYDLEDDIVEFAVAHYRSKVHNGDSIEFDVEVWAWWDPNSSRAEYRLTHEDGMDELPDYWTNEDSPGPQHLATICVEVFGHKVIM